MTILADGPPPHVAPHIAADVVPAAEAPPGTGDESVEPKDDDGLAEGGPNKDRFDEALRRPAAPPPIRTAFFQYGLAITGEFVASAGALCRVASAPCVLGSGGGIAARLGFRSGGPFYFGVAYELSKQDPNKLYRLAILQQARAEIRYYITTGLDTEPYLAFGGGVAGYGNEWGIDTVGPAAFVALGTETQVSRTNVVGAALGYRAVYFAPFTDTSRTSRDGALAHLVTLDLCLEVLDPR